MSKKILTIIFVLAIIITLTTSPAYTADCCLNISSTIAGADVYIDGVFTDKITPCTLDMDPGTYLVEIKIPGYITYSQSITLVSGNYDISNISLAPDLVLCDANHTIIVNTLTDKLRWSNASEKNSLSVSQLKSSADPISLREAIQAVENEPASSGHYAIEFDPSLSGGTIELFENHDPALILQWLIIGERGDMTINGDIDGDNHYDITIDPTVYGETDSPTDRCINITASNVSLNGIKFQASEQFGALNYRVPGDNTRAYNITNIKVLNCDFFGNGIEICNIGHYGNAGNSSGDKTITYDGVYFCGNTGDSANFNSMFAVGDEDYNTASNVYLCANNITDGTISIDGTDAHTWYAYGKDSIEGSGPNLDSIAYCEHNDVSNVIISGNSCSTIYISTSNMGNSYNSVHDCSIRNNHFSRLVLGCADAFDHDYGASLPAMPETSGNTLRNITIENNTITNTSDFEFLACNVTFSHTMPIANMSAQNNIMENIYFYDNVFNCSAFTCANIHGYNQLEIKEFNDNIMRNIYFNGNTFNHNGENTSQTTGVLITEISNSHANNTLNIHDNQTNDIHFTNNTINGYGLKITSCYATNKNNHSLSNVLVDSNVINETRDTKWGVMLSGAENGGYAHNGNHDCNINNITITNNTITAPNGILLCGSNSIYTGNVHSQNNTASNITISNNAFIHTGDGNINYGAVVLPAISYDYNYYKYNEISGHAVESYTLSGNTYSGYTSNIFDLYSVQNTFKKNELEDAGKYVQLFRDYTDGLGTQDAFYFEWRNDIEPDINTPGTYYLSLNAEHYCPETGEHGGSFTSYIPITITDEAFADFNNDNKVDMQDLMILAEHYNTNNDIYDINEDGVVNIYDLVVLAALIEN